MELEGNGKKIRLVLMFTLIFIICLGLLYMINMEESEQSIQPIAEEKKEEYWSIAIFGLDSQDEENPTIGTIADSHILCVIEKNSGTIKLVPVHRNTFMQLEESGGDYGSIMDAYPSGGPEQTVMALNQNLDLNITNYVSFNWSALADVINLLDGVDIEITEAEFKYINAFITETVRATEVASSHVKSYGWNHLDGVQALAYCRLRMMETDPESPLRWEAVMKQVFEKIGTADKKTLKLVIDTVVPQVVTTIDEVDFAIMKEKGKFQGVKIEPFPFKYTTVEMDKNGGCLIPDTLETNVKELHRFLYGVEDYQCSEKVKTINQELLKQSD